MAWENLHEDMLEEFGEHAECAREAGVRELLQRGDVFLARVSHRTGSSESDFTAALRVKVARRAEARGVATPQQLEMAERERARVRRWLRDIASVAKDRNRAPRRWTAEEISAAGSDISTKELALLLGSRYQAACALRAKVLRGFDPQPRKPGRKPAAPKNNEPRPEPKGCYETPAGRFQAYVYLSRRNRVTLGNYASRAEAAEISEKARRFLDANFEARASDIRAHVGAKVRRKTGATVPFAGLREDVGG